MADVLQSVVGGADGCIFSFGHMSLGKCSVTPVHPCCLLAVLPLHSPPPQADSLLPSLSLALVEEEGGCGSGGLTAKQGQAELESRGLRVAGCGIKALWVGSRTLGTFLSLEVF